jgi:hypothetical protein
MRGEVSQIRDGLTAVLAEADTSLSNAAVAMSGMTWQDPAARQITGGVCTGKDYAVDCSLVDASGIMRIVEPQEYRKYEGSDISGQAAVQEVLSAKKPVIGSMFETVEHVLAAVIQYPVLDSSGELTEFLSLLFQPAVWCRDVIEPQLAGTNYSSWVMQKDGLIVYESDPAQIGLNLFTDSAYQDYPELLALGRRMVEERQGEGVYSFTVSGGNQVVTKKAAWDTVEQYGYQWKVVVYRMVE